jgi:molecular chaperone GrpE (heat shock protein)
MLAELAAANAAFSVIKQAVQNSGDIAKAGSAIAKFVGAKEDLQKKASKKGGGSDLEEFMALEQIREKEEQLKQFMIYCGRPGLWGDWQRFQAKARVARREAEENAKRKRKQIIEISIVTFLIIVGLGILACFILLILHAQGRL